MSYDVGEELINPNVENPQRTHRAALELVKEKLPWMSPERWDRFIIGQQRDRTSTNQRRLVCMILRKKGWSYAEIGNVILRHYTTVRQLLLGKAGREPLL